jgi:fatty-acyl-CoA synthase
VRRGRQARRLCRRAVAYVQPLKDAKVTADELKAFVRAEITERAGTPDEIFLIDPLPLTDIGKPNKAQLRQDAAVRTFKTVLGAALGGEADIAVDVAPDKTHGTLATIRVSGSASERDALEAKIAVVMKAYTMQHRIAWSAR